MELTKNAPSDPLACACINLPLPPTDAPVLAYSHSTLPLQMKILSLECDLTPAVEPYTSATTQTRVEGAFARRSSIDEAAYILRGAVITLIAGLNIFFEHDGRRGLAVARAQLCGRRLCVLNSE